MFLSDKDIKTEVADGAIVIKGYDENRVQPASYDILLGNKFLISNTEGLTAIDPVNKIYPTQREVTIKDGEPFILHPGSTVLGTSVDYFGSDKYLIQLGGKSSLARIGLIVHATAGIINPGHFLNITFELCNLNSLPIILRPGMRIAQITFSQLTSPPVKDYKTTGRYQGRDWQHFVDPREEERRAKLAIAREEAKAAKAAKSVKKTPKTDKK